MQEHEQKYEELQQPNVQDLVDRVEAQTNSLLLTIGVASGLPPKFFLKNLRSAIELSWTAPLEEKGSQGLRQALTAYHKEDYPNLNANENVLIVNGAQVALTNSIGAFINPGQQIITFDPSYIYYRSEAKLYGVKMVGVSLYPKKDQTREQILKRLESKEKLRHTEDDEWTFSYEELQKAFNQNTRAIVINSPHNPTGKVFTNADLDFIGSLLKKYPKVVVFQDNIYEKFVFDGFDIRSVTKLSQRQEFSHRCICFYSGGKLFKACGIRLGWILGPKTLLNYVRQINSRHFSFTSAVLQKCVEESINQVLDPKCQYLIEERDRLEKNRNLAVMEMAKCDFDISMWVPQSGFFLLLDISRMKVKEERYLTDYEQKPVTKDCSIAIQLAYEHQVTLFPCYSFFGETASNRQQFLRMTYCKEKELILEAGSQLQAQPNPLP